MLRCCSRTSAILRLVNCNSVFLKFALRTICLVAIYYTFSIGLTFYQKWLLKDFHFPLSVVICHLVGKFIFALVLREIYECWTKKERIVLNWTNYLKRLSAVGVTSALDIGLSNWSFEFITISLYTMSKSSCIIFILFFSFIFGLEKIQYSLITVVLLIAVGLFLFTYHSAQFNLEGFLLVMAAALMGGLRWTLAQLVMQKKELGLHNPVDMVYHIQPWMILGILPFAIAIEGLPLATNNKTFRFEDITVPLNTSCLILIGCILAFFMEITEFLLLNFTSSLTLSMAGIIKEVFTMYIAWWFNGDVISKVNFIGLVIAITGISLHVFLKSLRSGDYKQSEDISEVKLHLLNEPCASEDEDVLYEMKSIPKRNS